MVKFTKVVRRLVAFDGFSRWTDNLWKFTLPKGWFLNDSIAFSRNFHYQHGGVACLWSFGGNTWNCFWLVFNHLCCNSKWLFANIYLKNYVFFLFYISLSNKKYLNLQRTSGNKRHVEIFRYQLYSNQLDFENKTSTEISSYNSASEAITTIHWWI